MSVKLPFKTSFAATCLKNGKQLFTAKFKQQVRHLNVHEHVSYTLLRDHQIPVPKFFVANSPEEVVKRATELNTRDMVLKAQVLAGGRGRGTFKNGFQGGVRMVTTPEQAGEYASKMIKQLLVTKQTGPAGRICNKVMITERKFPRREFYMAIMMERSFNGPVIIASSQGGVSIEDVAKENPDAIIYEPIDIMKGITDEQICRVLDKIGLVEEADEVAPVIKQMYKLFLEKDALLVEINPFAEDAITNKFFCLDAKFRFDDNAKFRQKKLHALRDETQEDPKEVYAKKYQLNFISLDGTIGCMVNGAGLAMAVLDIIKLKGGDPANFLDVGGGNTSEAVAEALRMILSDPNVSAIFVNVFGGITACDTIAIGIIDAAKNLNIKVPIIVRLMGSKSDEAQEMIRNSGLQIISEQDMEKAADIVVKLSKIVSMAKEVGAEEVMFKFGKSPGSGGARGKSNTSTMCRNFSSHSVCDGEDKDKNKNKDPCKKLKKKEIKIPRCESSKKKDDDNPCGGSLNAKIGMGRKKKGGDDLCK